MFESVAVRQRREREGAFRFIDLHPAVADLRAEVLHGLARTPKEIPAKLFYDAQGSALFEKITELPEYYLTRTEIGILRRHAGEMVANFGESFSLIEFGSGSSTKVRILLDAAAAPAEYMPIDISRDLLRWSAREIWRDYPLIAVSAVCADYTKLSSLPPPLASGKMVVFFPGSTIGNLTEEEAHEFLTSTARVLRRGDLMVVGTDLRKERAVLHAAYNDAQGVTAEFNLNVLRRLNRELDAGFDVDAFDHVAFFNDAASRIEMHLRSTRRQTASIGGAEVTVEAGEMIHTENSYKYDLDSFREIVSGTGFAPKRVWTDASSFFAVHLLEIA